MHLQSGPWTQACWYRAVARKVGRPPFASRLDDFIESIRLFNENNDYETYSNSNYNEQSPPNNGEEYNSNDYNNSEQTENDNSVSRADTLKAILIK